MLQELATTIGTLKAILTKLEHGEGTLGALLNDPSVYDQVQAMLDGTNRSWLLRWAVRHALKTHEQHRSEGRAE